MKVVSFAGVLVLLLIMAGTANAASPGLKLEISASSATYDHIGQNITYTYKVTNSGDVKIPGPVIVMDNKVGKFTIKIKEIARGATLTFNANYKITANDLKKGSVTKLASAVGTYNKRKITSKTVSNTINVNRKPYLTIETSASPTTYDHDGQIITYTYKVSNSGSFKISEPITVTVNKKDKFKLKIKDLAVGKVVSFKTTYKITDQDLKADSVTNLAYAEGIYNKQKVISDTVSITVKAKLPLKIEKSASPMTYDHIGQIITYTYKVTNSGSFKITAPINVTDDKIGIFKLKINDLAPGKIVSFKSTYKITDQDLKAGSVTNLAYATSIYNKQKIISNTASQTVKTQKLEMIIEKSASPTTYDFAGQTILYTYRVTNSGDVKISGPISVTDNKTGTFTISTQDLAPGAMVNGNSTYRITDQDLKNNSVTNFAYATGSVIIYPSEADPMANNINIVGCSRKNVTSNETQVTIIKKRIDVPEFPSIVLPVITIIGIIFILGRKNKIY